MLARMSTIKQVVIYILMTKLPVNFHALLHLSNIKIKMSRQIKKHHRTKMDAGTSLETNFASGRPGLRTQRKT